MVCNLEMRFLLHDGDFYMLRDIFRIQFLMQELDFDEILIFSNISKWQILAV